VSSRASQELLNRVMPVSGGPHEEALGDEAHSSRSATSRTHSRSRAANIFVQSNTRFSHSMQTQLDEAHVPPTMKLRVRPVPGASQPRRRPTREERMADEIVYGSGIAGRRAQAAAANAAAAGGLAHSSSHGDGFGGQLTRRIASSTNLAARMLSISCAQDTHASVPIRSFYAEH
jgi:hypothetical protein